MFNFRLSRSWGLFLGIPFTAIVVGLLVYGNLVGSSSNAVAFTWEQQPALYVCDTAPSWVTPGNEKFDKALQFWADQGWTFSAVERGPCSEICEITSAAGGKGVKTCSRGKVVIDLVDQWSSPDHAGTCTYSKSAQTSGVMPSTGWATIALPSLILEPGGQVAEQLPLGVDSIVLAHEIGHCLVGLKHNVGASLGCANLNPKTGHVMNPNTYRGGWGSEALPAAPVSWQQAESLP